MGKAHTHSCQEFSCQLLRANTTHYPSLAAERTIAALSCFQVEVLLQRPD